MQKSCGKEGNTRYAKQGSAESTPSSSEGEYLVAFFIFVGFLVALPFLAGGGDGQAPPSSPSTPPLPRSTAVRVLPMRIMAENSRRMLNECQEPESGDQDETGGSLASTITCEADDGGVVDVTPHYQFWYLLGSGYEGAFGACSQTPMMTGPYAFSHAGGMLVEEYDKLNPSGQKIISAYLNAISDYGTLADMIHDAAYDYSCYPKDYLHQPDAYTCGLQYITVAGGFPGAACKAVRDECAKDSVCSNFLNNEMSPPLFDNSSGLGEYYTELRGICGNMFGAISMFPIVKQVLDSKMSDAYVRVRVPFQLNEGGQFSKARVELVTGKSVSGQCTMRLVVQVGTPSCDDVIDAVGQFESASPTPEAVSSYDLEKFGFEYSTNASLWHREGARECDLGCCDKCFQWYCQHQSSPSPQYQCVNYTYQCEGHLSSETQTFYNASSEQVCGEKSKYTRNGEAKEAPRRRCGS